MARPTKDPANPLTFRVNLRMTDAEGQQLADDAAAAGLTVSDHLRGLAVQAQPRRMKATPDRAALIEALGPLGFIRSDMIHVRADINQLLKDRWAYKFVSPERVDAALAKLETAISRVEAIADHVFNQLENDR
jgi:hypothetical protein